MSSTTNANRSNQVRQRRTNRSQDRLKNTAHHSRTHEGYVANPLITLSRAQSATARGAGMGQPVFHRTATLPRRVYTVTMQKSRPALSIPAPTIRFGWRGLSAVLAIGLTALLYLVLNSSQFQVDQPLINGASRISINDVEAVLKLGGRSVFTIDPYQIAGDLQKSFPELNGISVAVGIPNTVNVQFDERQPVLAWKQKDQVRWVDSHGVIFNALGKAPANLVTVTSEGNPPPYQIVPTPGPTPTLAATPASGSVAATPLPEGVPARIDLQILSSALLLSKHLPDKAILLYSEKEGLGWRDSRGWDVYFGKSMAELETKISMVQAIVDQLNQKKIKPVYINLELINAPYYRLER